MQQRPKITMEEMRQRIAPKKFGTNAGQDSNTNPGPESVGSTQQQAGHLIPEMSDKEFRLMMDDLRFLKRMYFGQPELGTPGFADRMREIDERISTIQSGTTRIEQWIGQLLGAFKSLSEVLGIEEEEDKKDG